MRSHPSRGAWIEISAALSNSTAAASRTPHGVRGLKCADLCDAGRTPHGVRGLKSRIERQHQLVVVVAPLTGCVD